MAKRICSVTDCDKPARTRGWCPTHYARVLRWGDPMGFAPERELPTCSVPGCDLVHDSLGYCNPHYQRFKRNGDPGPADVVEYKRGATCQVEGCGEKHYGKGYCQKHWRRLHKHGDVSVVLPGRWSGDEVGYSAVHERLVRYRGRASDFPCVLCGAPARDWSYDGLCPNEKVSVKTDGTQRYELAYSTDPGRYQPLCRACHSARDDNYPQTLGLVSRLT